MCEGWREYTPAKPRERRKRKKNADDRLRRLERAAASGDNEDILRFAEEMFRTGKWLRKTGYRGQVLADVSHEIYDSPWCYRLPVTYPIGDYLDDGEGPKATREIGGVVFEAFGNPWRNDKIIFWIAPAYVEPVFTDPQSEFHVPVWAVVVEKRR